MEGAVTASLPDDGHDGQKTACRLRGQTEYLIDQIILYICGNIGDLWSCTSSTAGKIEKYSQGMEDLTLNPIGNVSVQTHRMSLGIRTCNIKCMIYPDNACSDPKECTAFTGLLQNKNYTEPKL